MSPRTIHLRRPAVLSVQEGVFVPPRLPRGMPEVPQLMDEVDRRWADLCRANPAYYDGRLYHVLGVHRNGHGGAVLHVIDCAYRFFAVQDDSFDLGVRALGVKAITTRDDRILIGLRSPQVASYRNMWEFAPAGSVEPPNDPAQVIQNELIEETALHSASEPVPIAVLFDPVLRCWEIVFRLMADKGEARPRQNEYTRLEWRSRRELPPLDQFSPIARQIHELL